MRQHETFHTHSLNHQNAPLNIWSLIGLEDHNAQSGRQYAQTLLKLRGPQPLIFCRWMDVQQELQVSCRNFDCFDMLDPRWFLSSESSAGTADPCPSPNCDKTLHSWNSSTLGLLLFCYFPEMLDFQKLRFVHCFLSSKKWLCSRIASYITRKVSSRQVHRRLNRMSTTFLLQKHFKRQLVGWNYIVS